MLFQTAPLASYKHYINSMKILTKKKFLATPLICWKATAPKDCWWQDKSNYTWSTDQAQYVLLAQIAGWRWLDWSGISAAHPYLSLGCTLWACSTLHPPQTWFRPLKRQLASYYKINKLYHVILGQTLKKVWSGNVPSYSWRNKIIGRTRSNWYFNIGLF